MSGSPEATLRLAEDLCITQLTPEWCNDSHGWVEGTSIITVIQKAKMDEEIRNRAIDRIRRDRMNSEEPYAGDGYDEGWKWVLEDATWNQLHDLLKRATEAVNNSGDGMSLEFYLYSTTIEPGSSANEEEVTGWWTERGAPADDRAGRRGFAYGFALGACSALREILPAATRPTATWPREIISFL